MHFASNSGLSSFIPVKQLIEKNPNPTVIFYLFANRIEEKNQRTSSKFTRSFIKKKLTKVVRTIKTMRAVPKQISTLFPTPRMQHSNSLVREINH
jgi:hypothetical protein